MGAHNSKPLHPSQAVTLLWNDELIGHCHFIDLERNFPQLLRGPVKIDPRGERPTRLGRNLIYDLAPCKDVVLWTARPEQHSTDDLRLVSPKRFGGSETLRVVSFTLFGRIKNMSRSSVNTALVEAFVGYPLRHDFTQRDLRPQINDNELGERDITSFLTLLESFVEVSTILDCLDNGSNPIRVEIENSYHKYRKHIKHNLDNVDEQLRFLRVGDILSDKEMIQDFTFPVLTSFETLFRQYQANANNITFAQYGERQWNLSRRLCDYLELEHKEFQKRKKAREQAILNEVPLGPRPLHHGMEGDIYGSGVGEDGYFDGMFLTLSPMVLQKLIERSPVTVDPNQVVSFPQIDEDGTHLGLGMTSPNRKAYDNEHVVIQLRVFRNPGKHNLSGDGNRLTPLQTPIPSRRGSPAPTDYFFGDHAHGFPPRSSGNLGGGSGLNGRHGLPRNNTFHGIDDHFAFPHKGDFAGADLGRFKEDRLRARMGGGIGDMGMMVDGRGLDGFGGMGVGGMDLQSVMARIMQKSVKEEKKREYIMPWLRGGNVTSANGTKLIGYTADGYRS